MADNKSKEVDQRVRASGRLSRREFLMVGGELAKDVALSLVLVGCGVKLESTPDEPTPTNLPESPPEIVFPSPEPANFSPEITPTAPNEANFIPAINPPEYQAAGGEITGVTPEELKDLALSQWYRLFKKENELEGQPYYFTDQAEYENAMNQLTASHSEISLHQVQSADKTSVLTYMVENKGKVNYVYWGFTPEGAVAFAEPNLVDKNGQTRLDTIVVPEGLRPEFVYNSEDKHWYMFGVNEQGEAKVWFNTFEATRDNLDEQWTKVEEKLGSVETEFTGIFSEKYGPKISKSYVYKDEALGIEFPLHLGVSEHFTQVVDFNLSDFNLQYLGEIWLIACYTRYVEIMGNELSLEEYKGLVSRGEGQFSYDYYDELTSGPPKTVLVDPLDGVSMTSSGAKGMPFRDSASNSLRPLHSYYSANQWGMPILAREINLEETKESEENFIKKYGSIDLLYQTTIFNGFINMMGGFATVTPVNIVQGGGISRISELFNSQVVNAQKRIFPSGVIPDGYGLEVIFSDK